MNWTIVSAICALALAVTKTSAVTLIINEDDSSKLDFTVDWADDVAFGFDASNFTAPDSLNANQRNGFIILGNLQLTDYFQSTGIPFAFSPTHPGGTVLDPILNITVLRSDPIFANALFFFTEGQPGEPPPLPFTLPTSISAVAGKPDAARFVYSGFGLVPEDASSAVLLAGALGGMLIVSRFRKGTKDVRAA
jgi:hypothetical protein